MKTDERVRMMDEVISGIQVIKMYAWEKPFEALIRFARKAELKVVTKSSYVRGLYMTFNLFTTRAALFATLLTMVLTDQKITATKVSNEYLKQMPFFPKVPTKIKKYCFQIKASYFAVLWTNIYNNISGIIITFTDHRIMYLDVHKV